MKRLLLVLLIVSGCKVVKKSVDHDCYLKKIKKESLSLLFKGYTLEIPEDWYSSFGAHCILFHSPKKLKKRGVIYYGNKITIHRIVGKASEQYKGVDDLVKEASLRHKEEKEEFYVSELYHKDYGKYYTIKSGHSWNLRNYTDVRAYFFYKKKGFIITYSSLNKYYDEFLPDVDKILKSFKILESN